jgi:hypothetical protein
MSSVAIFFSPPARLQLPDCDHSVPETGGREQRRVRESGLFRSDKIGARRRGTPYGRTHLWQAALSLLLRTHNA